MEMYEQEDYDIEDLIDVFDDSIDDDCYMANGMEVVTTATNNTITANATGIAVNDATNFHGFANVSIAEAKSMLEWASKPRVYIDEVPEVVCMLICL
jgi:hypothetical protein